MKNIEPVWCVISTMFVNPFREMPLLSIVSAVIPTQRVISDLLIVY